jgi:hypothetical protein
VLGGDGPVDPALAAAAADLLHRHLTEEVAPQEWVQAVEHDPAIERWYVRFGCEGRDAATIYFDLHQRSLHYEVYFLPDPPARHEELYRLLLRANHEIYSARFSIGPDGDLYLAGRVLLEHLDAAELDRVIGVVYSVTERWFPPAVGIAFRRSPPRRPDDTE